ncbi:MAG: dihydropyrimidinase [Anaerolineaceae bacterium]
MAVLIKNGTIITASETYSADLLLDGGKIARIEPHMSVDGAEVVDATGKLILPGGVDAHTHFELEMAYGVYSSDDHYTGHKAAAFGGTTTALDFIAQDVQPLVDNVARWHRKADAKAAIDYGFHMNITHFDESVAKDIPRLVDEGVTSLKVFTAYNGRLRISDGDIFKVLRIAAESGMLVMVHAENGDVIDILVEEALAAGHKTPEWHSLTRPAGGAVEAALRVAMLAQAADAPIYLVHMNTAGEADQLAYARELGIRMMGETCPQYLFFSIEDMRRPDGAKWVCSPPMRTADDNAGLWQALQEGTIQTVATDHCAFFYDGTKPILYEGKPVTMPGKELGKDDFTHIPNGLPGVGDRLPVMWTEGVVKGRMTPNQFVALMCTNPAKIFGLYPQKGTIVAGSDADVVIWDPEKKVRYGVEKAQHRTDYNLYEGWELTGYPEKVYLRGSLIVDGDRWLGHAGMGQFLKRKPFAPEL